MVALYYLSVFLIFHLAEAQNQSAVICPKEFQCGKLRNVSFPFSIPSQPDCGLYTIDCAVAPNPQINLGGGNIYDVLRQPPMAKAFRVENLRLKDLFANRSCHSFDQSLSFPTSPTITFGMNVRRNFTLFRCTKSTNDYSYFRDYEKYTNCTDFDIYYKYPAGKIRKGAPEIHNIIPDNCSLVHLPSIRNPPSNNASLFDLLTAIFRLQWSVSDSCSTCYYQGGQCLTDREKKFHCSSRPKGAVRRKSKRVLAAVLPAVIGSIFLCFIVIWRLNKVKGSCSHFFKRNAYSDPSRRKDLQEGSNYCGIHVFSYSTLEEATNSFDSAKELGDGGFGTVYHGKLRDGREVAVKRLYEQNSKRMEQFRNEIEILTSLRHQNLVTLYGCTSRHSRELLLVYEYVPNGTVADHLNGDKAENKPLIWSIRMKIAIETARALAYLHASDIIHRDVKTSNILLDNNFCVKVADFGLSRVFPHDATHVSTAPQGTPGYVDPEYHTCFQLTNKSDVYSFGVVLIELISSLPAVDIQRDEISLAKFAMSKILKCAFEELIDPSLGYMSDPEIQRMTTSVAELAVQCLQLKKETRPSMEQALQVLEAIEKGDELNCAQENDVRLMKSRIPPSPNSVNDNWVSCSTTISISG